MATMPLGCLVAGTIATRFHVVPGRLPADGAAVRAPPAPAAAPGLSDYIQRGLMEADQEVELISKPAAWRNAGRGPVSVPAAAYNRRGAH
jgi:hypothetical protein